MFFAEVSATELFNAATADSRRILSEVLNSSSAQSGRISAVRHEPLTLDQKFAFLKKKIDAGKIKLAPHVSIETIKHELMSNKDTYKDLSTDKIEGKLKSKEMGMLQDVKAPAHKPADPRLLLGLPALTPAFLN
jgi:hypothetical protein